MSNIFKKSVITSDDAVATGDSLGSGFKVLPTGAYKAKVVVAYISKSLTSESLSALVTFKLENGAELKERFLLTNKKGENYYVRDNDKVIFDGYTNFKDLAAFTANLSLDALDETEKTIEVYDFEKKTNVYKQVTAFPELEGEEVTLLIVNQKVNKQQSVMVNGVTTYKKTAETRNENTVRKVLSSAGFTFTEQSEDATTPEYLNKWLDLYNGKEIDRTDKSLTETKEASVKPSTAKSLFQK